LAHVPYAKWGVGPNIIMSPPLPTLKGGPLIDIEPEDPITEETSYCNFCWENNKKKRLIFNPLTNYYICYKQHRLRQEQVKELDSKYRVIQFPRDQFDNTPKRLTTEQRQEFVKQFNEERKNRKINLIWLR
jgi:hypothetical protein